jgi:hypothetical protein
MLSPEYLRAVPDAMVALYAQAEEDILADMARRISGFDMLIPAAKYQMRRLEAMGETREAIVARMAALTGKSTKEITRIMTEAGEVSLSDDEALYKAAGLKANPLKASKAVRRALAAGLKKTNNEFKNLTKTTAKTATWQFERALDRAYMQIMSGGIDYTTAITRAVRDLSRDGVGAITYPTGKIDSLETAVRRATITGVNQTTGVMREARMDEMDVDLVEVSAHSGARPSHAAWQGKIYSLHGNGKSKKYRDLRQATGYGTGPGLKGWNCSHDFSAYIEGFPRAYSAEQLDEYNAKTVEYNGKKMTVYEASQTQRGIERNIRKYKREFTAMGTAGLDQTESAAMLGQWNARQRDFLAQTGLKPQAARAVVGGFGRSEAAKAGAVTRRINALEKSTGMGYTQLKSGYDKAVAKGDISPLVGLEGYTKMASAIQSQLVGLKSADGTVIKGYTPHFIDRVIGQISVESDPLPGKRQGVSVGQVKEAILGGEPGKTQTNARGQKSIVLSNEKVKVTINPETGYLVQTNKAKRKKE